MKIVISCVLLLSLSSVLGCRHQATAGEIKAYYDEQHDRAQLEIDRKEVENAELAEEIAREEGKRVDHAALNKAKAIVMTDEIVVGSWDDRHQMERDFQALR